jgi:uncharacterized protein YqeY
MLRAAISEALTTAMKARDRATITAMRTALAAVANAEAVDGSARGPGAGAYATEVERRALSDEQVGDIVRELRDELRAASDEMSRLGQEPRAAELTEQANALDRVLGG